MFWKKKLKEEEIENIKLTYLKEDKRFNFNGKKRLLKFSFQVYLFYTYNYTYINIFIIFN